MAYYPGASVISRECTYVFLPSISPHNFLLFFYFLSLSACLAFNVSSQNLLKSPQYKLVEILLWYRGVFTDAVGRLRAFVGVDVLVFLWQHKGLFILKLRNQVRLFIYASFVPSISLALILQRITVMQCRSTSYFCSNYLNCLDIRFNKIFVVIPVDISSIYSLPALHSLQTTGHKLVDLIVV